MIVAANAIADAGRCETVVSFTDFIFWCFEFKSVVFAGLVFDLFKSSKSNGVISLCSLLKYDSTFVCAASFVRLAPGAFSGSIKRKDIGFPAASRKT